MTKKIYRHVKALNKWVIRCPHCMNAYASDNKDSTCKICHKDLSLTDRLDKLSKILLK